MIPKANILLVIALTEVRRNPASIYAPAGLVRVVIVSTHPQLPLAESHL